MTEARRSGVTLPGVAATADELREKIRTDYFMRTGNQPAPPLGERMST
jgi:hypothetical protein